MNEYKLGENLVSLRRKAKMTQDQLAAYMGVSKSSVSKWETSTTLPDILLLPQLATLFNVTLDELMGYEPQLSTKAIDELYIELTKQFAHDPQAAYEHGEELIRKYYSCFPFLYQMVILYLNHYPLVDDKEGMLKRAQTLCERILAKSQDAALMKDTLSIQAMVFMLSQKPEEALAILGERARPIPQDSELIAGCFQQLGDLQRTKEIMQIAIFQHLLFTIQDLGLYLSVNLDERDICKETMTRIQTLLTAFHVDKLHESTYIQAHIVILHAYATWQDKEATLQELETLCDYLIDHDILHMELHGDSYFTYVESWLKAEHVRVEPPRSALVMKESIIANLQEPLFAFIKEESRYQRCIKRLMAMED